MYAKYVSVMAKHAKLVFEEMTGTEVMGYKVKHDDRLSGMAQWVHIISYSHMERAVEGEFILGFDSEDITLAVASALAEKMGLDPTTEMDDITADLINEFLNTIVGRTISDWDRMGMPVKFSPPKFVKSTKFKSDQTVVTEAYVIILSLTFSHVIFRITFNEESQVKGETKRIMVAEDSSIIRNIIAKTLMNYNFEVKQAENGKRAEEIYKSFKPHLVLMDLVMPEMGGIEAMQAIKKFDPEARFIVLTSSARRDEVLTAKKIGVRAYLIKPFNADALMREVNKVFIA